MSGTSAAMPYVTFSKGASPRSKDAQNACKYIKGMLDNVRVRVRGESSIRSLAAHAAAEGFQRVIMIRTGKAKSLELIHVSKLGASYSWGKEYALAAVAGKFTIERGGKNSESTFVREARD